MENSINADVSVRHLSDNRVEVRLLFRCDMDGISVALMAASGRQLDILIKRKKHQKQNGRTDRSLILLSVKTTVVVLMSLHATIAWPEFGQAIGQYHARVSNERSLDQWHGTVTYLYFLLRSLS